MPPSLRDNLTHSRGRWHSAFVRQDVSEILTGRDLGGSPGSGEPGRRPVMAGKVYPPARAGARETRGAARRWWVLAVASVAQLMVVLDVTVVNIALPSAQRALAFSDADRQWVVTAYALAFGSLLLLGGKLSDLLGRNRTFMAGLAGFAAASALAGAAPNFAVLAAGRAAQGAFGALLAPAALATVTATFAGTPPRGPPLPRSRAAAAAAGPRRPRPRRLAHRADPGQRRDLLGVPVLDLLPADRPGLHPGPHRAGVPAHDRHHHHRLGPRRERAADPHRAAADPAARHARQRRRHGLADPPDRDQQLPRRRPRPAADPRPGPRPDPRPRHQPGHRPAPRPRHPRRIRAGH